MLGTITRQSKVYTLVNGEMVETGDRIDKDTPVNVKTFITDDNCQGFRGLGDGRYIKSANVQCEEDAAA